MTRFLAALFLVLATPAAAQQQATAAERTVMQLGQQLGALVLQGQQQQDTITVLQDQLAKAQARIKELESKKTD